MLQSITQNILGMFIKKGLLTSVPARDISNYAVPLNCVFLVNRLKTHHATQHKLSVCENCLPVAGAAPSSPQTKARAAASLVEAGTSGEGQEELDASGEKKKKSRRKKDPAAPKKALTAYLVFINAKREQVIKEHPEADLKDQVGFFRSHTMLFQRRSHSVCGRHSLLLRHAAMLSMKLRV